jgi:hypothetical protein
MKLAHVVKAAVAGEEKFLADDIFLFYFGSFFHDKSLVNFV